jgi:hypothetical protein
LRIERVYEAVDLVDLAARLGVRISEAWLGC